MSQSVIVIGGGPAGYAAAIYCAQLGSQVTLVEQAKLGGTCLYAGCIPTKVFVQAANLYSQLNGMKSYGISINGEVNVDFSKTAKMKNRIVKQLTQGVGYLVKKAGVEVINGYGRLKDAHTVEISIGGSSSERTADYIILACGSSEVVIPGLEPDGVSILNSTQMLDITALPESLCIIGGGVIGVEFATILSRFGRKVTIVEMTPTILPLEDEEVSAGLTEILRSNGVEVLTSTSASGIVSKDETGATLALKDAEGNVTEKRFEKVLVCVGRKPNLTSIGLDEVGIEYNRKFIETNNKMQTNVPNIFAIGDLTASPQLAHVGYYEAKIAALNIAGKEVLTDYTAIPSCVFSHPEISRVGMTEKMARECYGDDVQAKVVPFSGNGKALIEQEAEGFIKAVYLGADHKLLGMTVFGPKAAELITEPTLAIKEKLTIDSIADTIHAHPSVSEVLNEVAAAACGLSLHS